MNKIIKTQHQGFCYGVKHSIKMVNEVLNDKSYPRPIYLLNSIVHNYDVNNYFKSQGVIVLEGKSKLELLESINFGTIIFSAHGVSDLVKEKAKSMNIVTVDATCPFVEKSYQLIKKYLNDQYHLLYIGKNNHPETEAVLTFGGNITLVNNDNFSLPNTEKIAIAHQTTMSDYDVQSIYDKAIKINSNIKILPMMCNATKLRQDDLKNTLENNNLENTLVIIVGDKNSNNCTKLFELAKIYTNNAIFISTYNELSSLNFNNYHTFIVSSGTSTPIINVDNVVKYLKKKKIPLKIKLIEYIK